MNSHPRTNQMTRQMTSRVTQVAIASALVQLVACGPIGNSRKEAIQKVGAEDQLTLELKRATNGTYNPFAAENKAMAEKFLGASLDMLVEDGETGDQIALLDSGADAAALEEEKALVALASDQKDADKKDEKKDESKRARGLKFQFKGKKLNQVRDLNDRKLGNMQDSRFTRYINIRAAFKGMETVVSATGLARGEATTLIVDDASPRNFKVDASCAGSTCKRIIAVFTETKDAQVVGRTAAVFVFDKALKGYRIGWSAHPVENKLTASGSKRSIEELVRAGTRLKIPNQELLIEPKDTLKKKDDIEGTPKTDEKKSDTKKAEDQVDELKESVKPVETSPSKKEPESPIEFDVLDPLAPENKTVDPKNKSKEETQPGKKDIEILDI